MRAGGVTFTQISITVTYIDFIGLMENDLKGKELFRKYRYARVVLASAVEHLPHITFSGRLEDESLDGMRELFQNYADELKKFACSFGLNSIEYRKLVGYLEN
jgi:hypothetical protein